MTTTVKKIAEVRAQIVGLEAQLNAPEHSSLSRAELAATVASLVDKWHESAAERVADDLRLLAGGHSPDLLVGTAHEIEVQHFAIHEQALDARTWLVFAAGKDALLARFAPLIEAAPEGLGAAERARQRADLQRKLVEAEVREEALIRQAEAEGVITIPRPGQRPEASILIGWGA